jgi:hypothetical protein
MVEARISDGTLLLTVRGLHVLWALKRRFEIPLGHIREVRRAEPGIVQGWWKGFRAPGTQLPGVIVAGTYYQGGDRIFWDVRDDSGAIVIELANEWYARLIVEVADPEATVAMIRRALGQSGQGAV